MTKCYKKGHGTWPFLLSTFYGGGIWIKCPNSKKYIKNKAKNRYNPMNLTKIRYNCVKLDWN